ncbi:phytanoyl-CoA dioxygenase [Sneathiella sp. P13V-1]|uniref:phytanoyl-CoA dioxygenase family protein n=1 Tax=Sneathiella sp. P13V-1 TaxID=2697366 RepID=UPI00187B77FD|nr:phytanoyl-CoA dioxygenase family protein [Sneathiella sp. P13V-1]MBE7636261.1 phytanoyl-CoA dioxygenase [Sneathiella sp. P13V-1]
MSADYKKNEELSAEQHAEVMADFIAQGEQKAMALGNRGPARFDKDGNLHPEIMEKYWECGFYVFENFLSEDELSGLRVAVDRLLETAPINPETTLNKAGDVVDLSGYAKPPFRYAKPLSDPLGGTTQNKGRHPVKMQQVQVAEGAPDYTINFLDGTLHLMDEALWLYGHPSLLKIAEAVTGPDFVPYNEVAFIKEAGLGPAVAWHQDGTTHWNAADWNEGAHGFNSMTQLYPSTAGNCVWVIPGSHKSGKVDIPALVEKNGSDRFEEAVPMLCKGGEMIIMNRQIVHGSYANSSPARRVTMNAGFFPRERILDVTTEKLNGDLDTYTEKRVEERSRIIPLAVSARQQQFPEEVPYEYAPLQRSEEDLEWSDENRRNILFNYNRQDMYI